MLVGFIALLMSLRYLSLKLVLSDNNSNTKKGTTMKKTSTTRIIISACLETVWAIGVEGIVGQLST